MAEAPEHLVDWRTPALVQCANAVGLGDLLADRPQTAEELGDATGWRPDLMGRVLRGLSTRDLVRRDGDGRWELTEAGQPLRSDHPDSVAGIRLAGFELAGWTRMLDTLRTGRSSFEQTFGQGLWDWLADHPDDRAAFDEKMRTRLAVQMEMVAAYDWPDAGHLVDVGGGTGRMLTDVLTRRPGLTGTLFDVPATIAAARAVVDASGTADRCTLVPGSFFESVPAGGDLYLMSQIVHDWPDDDAVRILATVRDAMGRDARLLLLEGVMHDDGAPGPLALLDLHMLAMFGAGERDRHHWEALLERAGLRLDLVRPGRYVSWLEAVRA